MNARVRIPVPTLRRAYLLRFAAKWKIETVALTLGLNVEALTNGLQSKAARRGTGAGIRTDVH